MLPLMEESISQQLTAVNTEICYDVGMERRKYASPLRERQAEQTRNEILDALVALLADRPVDEVTTRELAQAAGVSERTVYRHFPDRRTLVESLTTRFINSGDLVPTYPERFEDLGLAAIEIMRALEAHHAEAQAEALLNADPRRFSTQTSRHSEQLRSLVETDMPDLDAGQQRSLAAILRVLISAQTWLRMRAEFGIDGETSGPVLAWVLEAMRHEIDRGNLPPTS